MKSYPISAGTAQLLRRDTPFHVFAPGIDAHAKLRAGSKIELVERDSGVKVEAVLTARHSGQLAALASTFGPSHYAALAAVDGSGVAYRPTEYHGVSSATSDFGPLVDELAAVYPDESREIDAIYTALSFIVPSEALADDPNV